MEKGKGGGGDTPWRENDLNSDIVRHRPYDSHTNTAHTQTAQAQAGQGSVRPPKGATATAAQRGGESTEVSMPITQKSLVTRLVTFPCARILPLTFAALQKWGNWLCTLRPGARPTLLTPIIVCPDAKSADGTARRGTAVWPPCQRSYTTKSVNQLHIYKSLSHRIAQAIIKVSLNPPFPIML
jgi:hypothetical protein